VPIAAIHRPQVASVENWSFPEMALRVFPYLSTTSSSRLSRNPGPKIGTTAYCGDVGLPRLDGSKSGKVLNTLMIDRSCQA
jgi:hypothetical protein